MILLFVFFRVLFFVNATSPFFFRNNSFLFLCVFVPCSSIQINVVLLSYLMYLYPLSTNANFLLLFQFIHTYIRRRRCHHEICVVVVVVVVSQPFSLLMNSLLCVLSFSGIHFILLLLLPSSIPSYG